MPPPSSFSKFCLVVALAVASRRLWVQMGGEISLIPSAYYSYWGEEPLLVPDVRASPPEETSWGSSAHPHSKFHNLNNSAVILRGVRDFFESLPQVLQDRLAKTAIVWTTRGVLTECEAARLWHLVETTPPAMDIWISHAHHTLNETQQAMSMAWLDRLPRVVRLVPQRRTPIPKFDTKQSGTSKSSFLAFVASVLDDGYDFVWHMENDVFYSGPWIEFFQEQAKDPTTDLIPMTIINQEEGHWRFDKRCKVLGDKCKAIAPYQCGWMLSRFSTRLARLLWENLANVTGHHEAVTIQFALRNNMTIRQLDPSAIDACRFRHAQHPKKLLYQNIGFFKPRYAALIHPVKCVAYDQGEFDIHQDLARWAYRNPLDTMDIWKKARYVNAKSLHIYWMPSSVSSDGSNSTSKRTPKNPMLELPALFQPATIVHTPRVSAQDVTKMTANGTLALWNDTLREVANSDTGLLMPPEFYSDVAETLTLAFAIQQAYEAGHDLALFISESTFITRFFLANWYKQRSRLDLRQPSWNVMVWRSDPRHPIIGGRAKGKAERWYHPSSSPESTQPDVSHDSPISISRKGMKKILSQICSRHSSVKSNRDGQIVWKIPHTTHKNSALSSLAEAALPDVFISESDLFYSKSSLDRMPSSFVVSTEYL